MQTKQRIDLLEKNFATILAWILGLDQKVNILLALQGIILALLIPGYLTTIVARFKTPHAITFINAGIVIIAAFLLGYSIVKSISAIYPRLGKKKTNTSHLYFGAIATYKLSDYKHDMKSLTEDKYTDELLEQIHINSIIADKKHREFRDALRYFVIGMILFIVCYLSLKIS